MSKLAELKAYAAQQSTPVLAQSLRMVDAMIAAGPATREDGQALRLTCAVIRDELEHRFPAAVAALDAAFARAESDGSEVDYSAVLLAHVPA